MHPTTRARGSWRNHAQEAHTGHEHGKTTHRHPTARSRAHVHTHTHTRTRAHTCSQAEDAQVCEKILNDLKSLIKIAKKRVDTRTPFEKFQVPCCLHPWV